MIVNLRESKARLSELVESASRGEDVLITVRGKIRARLTRATEAEASDMALWAGELQTRLNSQPAKGNSMVHWLDLDREDRTL